MICAEKSKLKTNITRLWNHRLPHLQRRWATQREKVTGDQVSGLQSRFGFELWGNMAAHIFREAAARVERTAVRRSHGARRFAPETDMAIRRIEIRASAARMWRAAGRRFGRGCQQCRREWMTGVGIKCILVGDFDYPAKVHDSHSMAHVFHDSQIVGDKQASYSHLLLQVHQQVQNLGLYRHVQGAYRFVTDDKPGLEGDSPGDADPLPLSAGKLVRVAVSVSGAKTDAFEKFVGEAASLSPLDSVYFKRFSDYPPDGHSRIEATERVLKDDLHLPAEAPHRRSRGVE